MQLGLITKANPKLRPWIPEQHSDTRNILGDLQKSSPFVHGTPIHYMRRYINMDTIQCHRLWTLKRRSRHGNRERRRKQKITSANSKVAQVPRGYYTCRSWNKSNFLRVPNVKIRDMSDRETSHLQPATNTYIFNIPSKPIDSRPCISMKDPKNAGQAAKHWSIYKMRFTRTIWPRVYNLAQRLSVTFIPANVFLTQPYSFPYKTPGGWCLSQLPTQFFSRQRPFPLEWPLPHTIHTRPQPRTPRTLGQIIIAQHTSIERYNWRATKCITV